MESSAKRIVLSCLIGLALALLLVGVVSGTVLRHIVQIVPIIRIRRKDRRCRRYGLLGRHLHAALNASFRRSAQVTTCLRT
jgi:Flp pilus assembly protein TadB